MYCSRVDKDGGSISEPRCCPKGSYWDADYFAGPRCRPYASCYDPSDPSYCNYFYAESSWWSNVYCINPSSLVACCPAELIGDPFGDGEPHFWPIRVG